MKLFAIKIVTKGEVKMYEKYSALLEETNKTSYQVSKDTGIGQNVLSNWKNKKTKPSLETLIVLAKYFGVTIEYFLETEEGE